MLGSYCCRENFPICVEWLIEYLIPLSKPDHDMPRHCHIRLQEDCSHRDYSCKHKLHTGLRVPSWQCTDCFARILQCRFVLSVEHCTPDYEVMIMHSVEFVELGFVPSYLYIPIICLYSCDVAIYSLLPLADPCIDV